MALDVGDLVYVVYWQPFPLAANPNNGTWETTAGRLISVGTKAASFETPNPSVMADGAMSYSTIRFADLDKIFTDPDAASKTAKELPPPTGV